MSRSHKPNTYTWLHGGVEIFPALLEAIAVAQKSIRLEVYIYAADELGRRVRDALVAAQRRGVQVRLLIDSLGSLTLLASFWELLLAAGGEVRWFNPVLLKRFGFRDHRKMLVCDEETAFVGGFNVAEAYNGDGIKSGWHDLGLKIVSPLAVQLAAAFDEMYARADMRHERLARLRSSTAKRNVVTEDGELLLSGPARGRNPFARALRKDLVRARSVKIIMAYFLPTWRIRRDLMRVTRNGGKVQLILPAKSDVWLSQFASLSLYRRLLKAGVEIYEYQPQILHAKLILIDDVVYAGSSNMDPRSLYINYELMVRFRNAQLVKEANELFDRDLKLCRQIEFETWRKSRTWWKRFRQRWAYFILVRIDPLIARWQPPG
jgi:cardiolipin synthase